MDAPIVNHAAAVFLYASPAVKHLPGALHAVFKHINVAQQPFLIDFLNDVVISVPASVLMSCEQAAGDFGKLHKLEKFLRVHGRRLFQDDVFAIEHCLLGQGFMKIIGSGYYYNAYLRIRKHFFI